MGLLEGKNAVIFGLANDKSIAWGIIQAFKREGANIGISYAGEMLERRVKPLAEKVDCKWVEECDVTKDEMITAVAEKAAAHFGKIDILVNCAGTRGPVGVSIADGDEKDWRLMFDVNSLGTMIVSKAVAKEMIRRNEGGKIVHIASAAGKLPCPGSAAYAASKWAVIGIVQALAMELAPYKINVNAINPGFFATNLRDDDATLHSKEKGITVICSLHFLDLVHRYATRAIALKDGEVVFQGLPKEIDDAQFKAIYGQEAERVSIVGPFNLWDGRKHAMQVRGGSGIWELFVPDVGPGTAYKYEIRTRAGHTILKADPYYASWLANASKLFPGFSPVNAQGNRPIGG